MDITTATGQQRTICSPLGMGVAVPPLMTDDCMEEHKGREDFRYSVDILRSVRVHAALQGLVLHHKELTTHGRKDAEQAEADPEGAIGGEGSRAKDLAAARLPHARQQLRDAAYMQRIQQSLPLLSRPKSLERMPAQPENLQAGAHRSRWHSSR